MKGVGGGGEGKRKIIFYIKINKTSFNYSSQIVERSCIIVTNWYWPRRFYVLCNISPAVNLRKSCEMGCSEVSWRGTLLYGDTKGSRDGSFSWQIFIFKGILRFFLFQIMCI